MVVTLRVSVYMLAMLRRQVEDRDPETLSTNLPGWRWVTITKVTLDRLSRSLHSDVCDSDGLRDAAIHSTISGRGSRRARAASNIMSIKTPASFQASPPPP